MRAETKRAYEKRIVELEAAVTRADERATNRFNRMRMFEDSYHSLKNARRQGEEARKWAVEQAIYAGQPNITTAAKQIADYVFGPDIEATREAETE